ncbi:MAG TPA: transposase [Casimicrobiaceae bacterium]|nr:transposase [Casimicrobiaceae bacterium]
MSRRPRFPLTDLPLHVVQRGNDRQQCFFEDRDYRIFLGALREAASRYGVLVHAYVLMTNHVHLLLTPGAVGAVARLMQSLGARYVWHVNSTRQRTGTLWEGRYRACLVARDQHVLAACRYIDLNPVRAGLARHPSDYRWSSYGALSGLRNDPLVTRHPALVELGTPEGHAYVRWCAQANCDEELGRIRDATEHELAFGSDEFKAQIEAMTMRATTSRPRGRPRRAVSACA